MRIEDTDKIRSTKESEQNIIEAMTWLDLRWDGNITRSSDNLLRYNELLSKLLKEEKAFYCHHTHEELESERKNQEVAKKPPRHVCDYKNTEKGKQSGGIIRLKVDDTNRTISFEDGIRGHVEFKQYLLGDFSIARAIDDPLYHFAVVVDDADMQINYVIRGEDHISNTPKHILIYEALGLPVPNFAHLPLILSPDRSKLSKRHGGIAVTDYKKDYLYQALLNFLGNLSYTFSKEIITKEEMIREFELSQVHKSGAIFDIKKLNWINAQYVKKLSAQEFKIATGILEIPDAAVPLITERLEKLSDAQNFDYFWKEPEYDKELLRWKKADLPRSKAALERVLEILNQVDFGENKLRTALDELGHELGDRGLAYWPLRVALTGKEKSPDPVEVAVILKKDIVLSRIKEAIRKLN